MAVYKEEKNGTWRAVYRYTDWNGERKQTQKRGFQTKREAQAWEREQVHKTSADLDMNFKSFVELYTANMKTRLKENTWATFDPDDDTPKRVKYYVNDVPVSIINERVQYLDADGKLITESLVDYTRKNIRKEYATLDEFLQRWNSAQKKTAIVEELEQKGIFFEELREEISKDLDPFDLICHIAFDMPPLTRKERANNVKKRGYFGKYNQVAKQVLEALLDKYADEGLANLESMEILKVPDVARFGTPVEILKCFGNKKKFMEASGSSFCLVIRALHQVCCRQRHRF